MLFFLFLFARFTRFYLSLFAIITALVISALGWPVSAVGATNDSGKQVNTFDAWYFSGSGGYFLPYDTSNQKIATYVDLPTDLYKSSSSDGSASFAAELGYVWHYNRNVLSRISLGLSLELSTPSSFHGTIREYSWEDNYIYHYEANYTALLGVLYADIFRSLRTHFFLLVGIGASRNRLSGYDEQAIAPVQPRESLNFSNRDYYSFVYLLGAGLRFMINARTDFTLRYTYIDLGKDVLGTGPIRPGIEGPGFALRGSAFMLGLVRYWR